MDFDTLLALLISKFPLGGMTLLGLGALGSLVVIGQAIVALTPSKSDDDKLAELQAKPIIGPILKALSKFAVIQKK